MSKKKFPPSFTCFTKIIAEQPTLTQYERSMYHNYERKKKISFVISFFNFEKFWVKPGFPFTQLNRANTQNVGIFFGHVLQKLLLSSHLSSNMRDQCIIWKRNNCTVYYSLLLYCRRILWIQQHDAAAASHSCVRSNRFLNGFLSNFVWRCILVNSTRLYCFWWCCPQCPVFYRVKGHILVEIFCALCRPHFLTDFFSNFVQMCIIVKSTHL